MSKTTPLGIEIMREIDSINDNNAGVTKYNMSKLAAAADMDDSLLYVYMSGKSRIGLQAVMRLIAVLGPTPDRATHIIRTAGYDISTDGWPENKDYREIVSLGAGNLRKKNEILERHGRYIASVFIRY